MGADYSFYVKAIETHARAFFKVIIFSIGSVKDAGCQVILYFAAAVKEGLLRLMYRVSISQIHAAS